MKVKTTLEVPYSFNRMFVLRALKQTGKCEYVVIAEKKFDFRPEYKEIAKFIEDSNCDFVSLVENFYRINNDLKGGMFNE